MKAGDNIFFHDFSGLVFKPPFQIQNQDMSQTGSRLRGTVRVNTSKDSDLLPSGTSHTLRSLRSSSSPLRVLPACADGHAITTGLNALIFF